MSILDFIFGKDGGHKRHPGVRRGTYLANDVIRDVSDATLNHLHNDCGAAGHVTRPVSGTKHGCICVNCGQTWGVDEDMR